MTATRLIVFLDSDGEEVIKRGDKFCGKPEQTAAVIRNFCARTKALVYPEHYVSVAVIRSDERICSSGAAIYAQSLNSLAVKYVVLKQSVLLDVCAVGNDDLLQLMTKIAKTWEAKQGNWKFLMRDVRNLVGESIASKEQLLLSATRNRGRHDYSEARLNRCIDQSDVEAWGDCGVNLLS
jgi:hypothetical protein